VLKAIIFDMGGTLEDVEHKPEYSRGCGEKILTYLKGHGIDLNMSSEELMQRLEKRNAEYRKWGIENGREITPFEIWSKWYLDHMDINLDRLRAISNNVANIWERSFYKRALRPDAPHTLRELKELGIRMGVISNTACQTQVIEILHEYGIHQYFDGCIYLSSLSGFRKPHPELFRAAAQDLDARPEECVYVGDTISRDVQGSRLAGFMASIRIDSHLTAGSDIGFAETTEDAEYRINNLTEILSIVQKLIVPAKGVEV